MTEEAVKSDVMTAAVLPKHTGELERSAHVGAMHLKQCTAKLVFDSPYVHQLYWHPEYEFR